MHVARILHVTTFLQGGAGRNIADLAIAQHRAGLDVLVVADAGGESGYRSYPEYVDELRAAGVPLARVHSTFKRDAALNTRAATALHRLTDGWRPHLVHAHATTPAVVARLARLGSAPVLNTMHGWGIAKTADQKASDIAVLESANAVVVPSVAAARTLNEAGLSRDDVHVIPYGLPVDTPSAAPDVKDAQKLSGLARGRRLCFCIGTIGARKNQQLLVDALATEALHDVIAVFIGDGETAPLQAHAREMRVADRVVIVGHRPRASRYLPLADAVVLPSRNEGLPLVVLESLRAAVPVVGSDVPEIAEALDGGRCGYLFRSEDARSLATALRAALAAPADARARFRARFEDHYSASRMFGAYARLYERLGS